MVSNVHETVVDLTTGPEFSQLDQAHKALRTSKSGWQEPDFSDEFAEDPDPPNLSSQENWVGNADLSLIRADQFEGLTTSEARSAQKISNAAGKQLCKVQDQFGQSMTRITQQAYEICQGYSQRMLADCREPIHPSQRESHPPWGTNDRERQGPP